jgi:hypothetical protein
MSTTEPDPRPDEPSLPSAPPLTPSESTAADGRGGLRLGVIGGLVGIALYTALIVLSLSSSDTDPGTRVFALFGGMIVLTIVATIAAVVLVIFQRTRPFAVGLLIAIGIGVVVSGGICIGVAPRVG